MLPKKLRSLCADRDALVFWGTTVLATLYLVTVPWLGPVA
jgi:hypothetical protein